MKHEVEVRISVERSVTEIWTLACDISSWPAMPGADLSLVLTVPTVPTPGHRIEYAITAGLPVRDHRGELDMTSTATGGTELVFIEAFRPRIWGTGGYLRGRRERALIDTAQWWGRVIPNRTEPPI